MATLWEDWMNVSCEKDGTSASEIEKKQRVYDERCLQLSRDNERALHAPLYEIILI